VTRLEVVHWILTSLLLLGWVLAGVLLASGALEVRWANRPPRHEQPYPIPGRLEGTTSFSHEENARPRANASYPDWFRGTGLDGWADERSRYHYTELVGPLSADTKLLANGVHFGTFVLQPGTTYPAHNHPAPEIYFILEGTADWWVDDEHQRVKPGSIILHRPHAVHGWRNDGDRPLKAVWVWWSEGDSTPDELTRGARLTNPKRDADPPGLPFADPLPPVRPD
jgi:quercetin dioxygenase-like cupin family protein